MAPGGQLVIALESFPGLNATLNGIATLLIATGLVLIRSGRRDAHRNAMLAAVAMSTAFLGCYLYYHFHHGSTRFAGEGAIRTFYFTVLLTHTILAAAVPFLVGTTVFFALRGNLERHRKIAKWTAPIWLYVSATGVVIYWMLYRM
jgi:uncharacterized membrane protein YozB (DUF420 family)